MVLTIVFIFHLYAMVLVCNGLHRYGMVSMVCNGMQWYEMVLEMVFIMHWSSMVWYGIVHNSIRMKWYLLSIGMQWYWQWYALVLVLVCNLCIGNGIGMQ